MAPLQVIRPRLDELAADTGRLRRRFNSNPSWTGSYIADRIAGHIQAIAFMLEPNAAQLAAWNAPGDEDALTEAIRLVDERSRRLRRLLGEAA